MWRRAPAATPFSSPAWLLPWSRHLASAPPWAVLAWRGRELVGFLPTFLYARGAERVVGLLGGEVSDYQDALVEDAAAADDLLGWLDSRRRRFDRCDLQSLPAWSPLLERDPPRALVAERALEDDCPVLALPARFEDLAGRASASLLHDVRYQLRRMERAGVVRFVRADPGSLPELLAELFRLQRTRWEARGEVGLLSGRRRRFHAEAAHALMAAGLLRWHALRLDGRTLSVVYGFAARRRAYAYLTGLDPAAFAQSPGSVLFAHVIRQAIGEGARELDFLRGRERYKYRWGCEDRPTHRLVLTPSAAARPSPAAPAPGSARRSS